LLHFSGIQRQKRSRLTLAAHRSIRPKLPEKARTPMARSAVGCGRYVPMRGRFGKGLAQSFFQFCDGQDEERHASIFESNISQIRHSWRHLRPHRARPGRHWRRQPGTGASRTSRLSFCTLAFGSVTREPPPIIPVALLCTPSHVPRLNTSLAMTTRTEHIRGRT
jgi:hypothetical protein